MYYEKKWKIIVYYTSWKNIRKYYYKYHKYYYIYYNITKYYKENKKILQ